MTTRARRNVALTAANASGVSRSAACRTARSSPCCQTAPLPVRNQLVSIYRRAEVSNRTELGPCWEVRLVED